MRLIDADEFKKPFGKPPYTGSVDVKNVINWLDVQPTVPTCQESRQVEEHDSVNHPEHYQLVKGVEVIEVIDRILNRSDFTGFEGYCLGNVIKYILRADMKNGKEDYKKAAVYLNWLIKNM